MNTKQILALVTKALSDLKARNITILDVQNISSVSDFMVIASGTSNRHVTGIAKHVAEEAKKRGEKPLGVEGEDSGEWALVDLGDVVVHVMQSQVRDFYQLEKLWTRMGEKSVAGQSSTK